MIKMNNQDLTLLSEGQIWGNNKESQLEVIRKYGFIFKFSYGFNMFSHSLLR